MAQKYRFYAVFLCFGIVKKQSELLKNKLVIGIYIKYNILIYKILAVEASIF